ncbi:MAG: N-6 DNA methylase [Bacteroidaceae bacterium]|nr:N-6 DNA methylase [Bacteroidaceae bacterium]
MARDRSIEEQVEDWCKRQFKRTSDYFTKTESINPEIEEALRKAPSKTGGEGSNFPDIKCFVETDELRCIPVMIEVKGTKGALAKLNDDGSVCNKNAKGEPHYTNIAKYAVNGAVHYAHAILDYADSYNEVIAVGVNGYREKGHDENTYEVSVWYVSKENLFVPKKVADYTDLSFLLSSNVKAFLQKVDALQLTDEEIEQQKTLLEDDIEQKLKALNEKMHAEQDIVPGDRVQLVAGMIMAGLGVKGVVEPLRIEDLRGQRGENSNDGMVFMNKISDYLQKKHLPSEKIQMITEILNKVFLHSKLEVPINGESRLKTFYRDVKHDIMPFVNGEMHNLDFTGRLFNVMNDWVAVPDGDQNDVVLTPRSATELMARLCRVNKDSYVWDFATGSAGFLISAMHLMIADAKEKISSPAECERKISQIKMEQLLGIEKLPDIYMLAVLNMILMKDGCSNIIHGDSFEFEGNYEQGKNKGCPFPANVFLLNPPYSADGKGFCFVERALGMMTHGGRAAVLIQENAGKEMGLPFTENILRNNTLLASIKMPPDLFIGKASVQTAIYVFEVNTPHDKNSIVKFIDFSNDGYSRQNRKKASLSVNLRDTDHAKERYEEVVNLVLYGNKYLHYLEGCYEEDTISLNGKYWTYGDHRRIDTHPTEADFRNVVQDYLVWRISDIIKSDRENGLGICFDDCTLTMEEKDVLEKGLSKSSNILMVRLGDLFDIHPTRHYECNNDELYQAKGNNPVVSNTSINNGIGGYSNLVVTESGNKITFSDTTTSDAIFYQPYDFVGYSHIQGLYPITQDVNWSEKSLLYIVAAFRKVAKGRFDYATKFTREIAKNMEIELPKSVSGDIDFEYMETYIRAMMKQTIAKLKLQLLQ